MYEINRSQADQGSTPSRVSPFVVDNFTSWQLGVSVPTEITSPYNLPIIGSKQIWSPLKADMFSHVFTCFQICLWTNNVTIMLY